MEVEKDLVKKRLLLFVALTTLLAWFCFMLIPLTGNTYGQGISILCLAAAMFAPAIGNLLTRLITKEGFQHLCLHPNFKGNLKSYLAVYLGTPLLLLLSMAIYFLIFPNHFDAQLTTLNQMIKAQGTPDVTANAVLTISVLQVMFIGPIINLIPTLGEELGWQGYLLPKLRLLVSDRQAILITGIIWGLWHAPVIAMGHNYGTNYIGYPFLGILAMAVFCMILAAIEGHFTIKTESVVPAAMIHSAVNAGAGLPLFLVKGNPNPLIGPSIVGIIGGLPFLLLAIFLWVRIGKEHRSNAS